MSHTTPRFVDAERVELGARLARAGRSFHSATTIRAPPLPRCSAMPLPMPRPDPVTMITLPSTACIASRRLTCVRQLTCASPLRRLVRSPCHERRNGDTRRSDGARDRRRERHRPGDRPRAAARRARRSRCVDRDRRERRARPRAMVARRRRHRDRVPVRRRPTTPRSPRRSRAANDDLGRITGVVTAAGIFHGPDLRPAHEVSRRRLRARVAREPRRHVRGHQARAAACSSTAAARS